MAVTEKIGKDSVVLYCICRKTVTCDKRVQNNIISTDCCISLVSLPVLCNIRPAITKTAMSILTGYLRRLCVFMQRVVDAFAISGLRYLRRLAVSRKKRRAADICSFWLDGGAVNSLKRRICNPDTSAEHTNHSITMKKKTSVLYKKKNCQQPKDWCCICWGVKNSYISVQDLQKRPKWLPFICN